MNKKINYPRTGNVKYDNAIRIFYNHLVLSSRAQSTYKRYTYILSDFILKMNKLPEECSKGEILDYFMEVKQERNYCSSTIRGYICAIKYYLKYIVNKFELFTHMPYPKTEPLNVDILTKHEIALMISNCTTIRDLLIIQMLYETGIRLSELVNLRIEDIDIYEQTIIIRNSKHRVTRLVTFGNRLKKTLERYINSNRSLFSDTLLFRKFHPHLKFSKTGIRFTLNKIVRKCKIRKRVNVHSLRHTFAVHYLNFGGTIYQLQRLLGHKSMYTTIHYLKYANFKDSKVVSVLDCVQKSNVESKLVRCLSVA